MTFSAMIVTEDRLTFYKTCNVLCAFIQIPIGCRLYGCRRTTIEIACFQINGSFIADLKERFAKGLPIQSCNMV